MKVFRQFIIFFITDGEQFLCPFSLSQHTVEPKVHKHAEAKIFKVLNILFDDHATVPPRLIFLM